MQTCYTLCEYRYTGGKYVSTRLLCIYMYMYTQDLVIVVYDVSTLVTWPVSANDDGACAVVLGGADGKAISSSWQLNARSPVE